MRCLVLILQVEPWWTCKTSHFLLYRNTSISSFSTWPGNADTQLLRQSCLITGDVTGGTVLWLQYFAREGRREKPKLSETLQKSVCIPLLISDYFIYFSAPAGDREPYSESGHASSFSLSRWPTPAHSLFHPVTSLKQILALHIPPACHLSTSDMTRDSKNIFLDECELGAAPLHDKTKAKKTKKKNQSCNVYVPNYLFSQDFWVRPIYTQNTT